MESWWNLVIELTVPFDTEAQARAALNDDGTTERILDAMHDAFGGCREAGRWRIEEVVDEET
jgi:hypothetical protein